MSSEHSGLLEAADQIFAQLAELTNQPRGLRARESGTAVYVGRGVARVVGLPGVQSDELILFPGDTIGMAFNLEPKEIGVVLFNQSEQLQAGAEALRTGEVLNVPVGERLLGRVIDATGRPLDNRGPLRTRERLPVERAAPPIMSRAPVEVPLQTGLKVVDALVPVGRGQRELILGDRQTGKTAIAIDTIINQRNTDVISIYCAIGQRMSAVAKVIAQLRAHGAMDQTIVVVASGEAPPGLQWITPYAATSMGEYFMERGRDVLIVYDDLTRHAQSYRELSLLLRRPPGREAYPGDIFYIHSRLLERSTRLRDTAGGGSLTALPIIETRAQNISAYIPTNLISITDGQIYLSPEMARKGLLPPVDVGKSVSRVGGKAQLAAYRAVSGNLRLSYTQFEELEVFSRFGTQLEEDTRRALEHGRRVRWMLRQPQYAPLPPAEQVALMLVVAEGLFDELPENQMAQAEQLVREAVSTQLPEICGRIEAGEKLSDEDSQALVGMARAVLQEEDLIDADA